jgi:hypothetical protein
MRDNPAGAAASKSSFWRERVSVRLGEPGIDVLLPSTPNVKGVTKAINFVADEAPTPLDLETVSTTEETSPPKIFPKCLCPALIR